MNKIDELYNARRALWTRYQRVKGSAELEVVEEIEHQLFDLFMRINLIERHVRYESMSEPQLRVELASNKADHARVQFTELPDWRKDHARMLIERDIRKLEAILREGERTTL